MKMTQYFPNAAEMRERINNRQTAEDEKQESVLSQKILEAADRNKSCITVNTLSLSIRSFLEKQGYKVQYRQGDVRDPRSPSYYLISW